MTADTIVLTIPREQGFEHVAQLVLDGVAARLDLSYERMDDLGTAVETLLRRADGGDVTVALRVEPEGFRARSALQVTVTAILINILNPKLSIFFLAFLPQFVAADDPQPLARMAMLSLVFMALTFVVFVGYGLFAASIRRHVISRPRVLTWMRRMFAAAFVALGAKLALADR